MDLNLASHLRVTDCAGGNGGTGDKRGETLEVSRSNGVEVLK